MAHHRPGCSGLTRRTFLAGASAVAATGLTARRSMPAASSFGGRAVEVARPENSMPGRFPGRVIEIRHPGCVGADHAIAAQPVQQMMRRGMCELTGAEHWTEAWGRFFERDDVVGIKVNPVGRKRQGLPNAVGSISSPEVLIEVVAGLRSAGVPARNIIVFERYAEEFRDAGYEAVLRSRPLDGVRWYASAEAYDNHQLDIEGYSRRRRRDRDPHVVGYDPDVFVHMGYAAPGTSSKDDRRFRSHLSLIVSRMISKMITLPVLKDHRSAGVTLALKNLSHGLNNNVARSHISNIYRRDKVESNPNQCNTFIPAAVAQEPIRKKATLHIMDGLIGVYEGGPGCWNPTWGTWQRKSLFFATDPVALDHVGWDIIDAERVRRGWQPVAQMGRAQLPAMMLSARLAALAGTLPMGNAALAVAGHLGRSQHTEQFDRRQPEHIYLASTMNLGTFDARHIEHRQVELS
ncbi:MAG: DUF362 domain-containing protein [Gemmataceae bacterium]